ncbi:hypothetical protein ACHAXT_002769 [Thalassiosira profunda]
MTILAATARGPAADSPLSLELVEQAKRHISFLQSLHRNGITTLTNPSDESFRRYTELWLPLVASVCRRTDAACKLIPPADIAWLWHCHRLAPYRYLDYVQERFFEKKLAWAEGKNKLAEELPPGEFLDTQYPFSFQLEGSATNATVTTDEEQTVCEETIRVFRAMYPNEHFFLDKNKSAEGSSSVDKRLSGFDLVESCQRQSTFLWQVSGPRFSSDSFLQQGADNYVRFIVLRRLKRHKYVVPTYQIDLIWHTHILMSIYGYHAENMRVNGMLMNHDDTLNDRTEGGDLDTNYRATCQLWYETYNEQYPVPGGMYRGEPPKQYFRPGWVDRAQKTSLSKFHRVLGRLLSRANRVDIKR